MKLTNVRLSFPSLFRKAVFQGTETKYEATFLLDKKTQADLIKKVQSTIDAFAKETFKGSPPKSLKITCFQDGDKKEYDGYEGKMAFKAASNRRFTIINRDKTPLTEEDEVLYAGCYVTALVSLWYSDHPKGGKQILGNLLGVQFVKDGEAFGEKAASVDEFDDLGDDEDDDTSF